MYQPKKKFCKTIAAVVKDDQVEELFFFCTESEAKGSFFRAKEKVLHSFQAVCTATPPSPVVCSV